MRPEQQKEILLKIKSQLARLSQFKKEQVEEFKQLSAQIIEDFKPFITFNEETKQPQAAIDLSADALELLNNTQIMSIFAYNMQLISTSPFKDANEVQSIFKFMTLCYEKLDLKDRIRIMEKMRADIRATFIREVTNGQGEKGLCLAHDDFTFLHRANSDLINSFSTDVLLVAKNIQKTAEQQMPAKRQTLDKATEATATYRREINSMDEGPLMTAYQQAEEQEKKAEQDFAQAEFTLAQATTLVDRAREMKIAFLKLGVQLVKAMTPAQRKQKMELDFKESVELAKQLFEEQKAIVAPLEAKVKEIEGELNEILIARTQLYSNPAALDKKSQDTEYVARMNTLIAQLPAHKQKLIHAKRNLAITREAFERIPLRDIAKENKKQRQREENAIASYNMAKKTERERASGKEEKNEISRPVMMAQLDLPVGDIQGNKKKIIEAIIAAAQKGCGSIIFPEMAITGYIPQDLLKHDEFLDESDAALKEIVATVKSKKLNITVHVGHPARDENEEPSGVKPGQYVKKLFNATSIISFNGDQEPAYQQVHYKNHLAVDGVFNEGRYFVTHQNKDFLKANNKIPAFVLAKHNDQSKTIVLQALADNLHNRGRRLPTIVEHDGRLVWSRCCEEVWHTTDPEELAFIKEAGVEAVFVNNGSPYAENKFELRRAVINDRVKETHLPHVYVNIGGTHVNLCYGGGSFIANPKKNDSGEISAEFEQAAPHFMDGNFEVRVKDNGRGGLAFEAENIYPDMIGKHYIAHRNFKALTMIMREHFKKVGLNHAILGLSGGADSALTVAIMAAALGGEKATAFLLPSIYTDMMSNVDAALECEELGVDYEMIFIDEISDAIKRSVGPFTQVLKDRWEKIAQNYEKTEGPERAKRFRDWRANCEKMADENMGACIRQHNILHYFSALLSAGNLATSNRAEVVSGYYTYKDMWGALAIIGDVAKHGIYGMLAEQDAVPGQVITRPPTAELAPGQKDQDSLPPYPVIDKIVELYFDNKQSPTEIALYMNHAWEMRDRYSCDLSMVNKVIRNSQLFRFKQIVGTHIAAISGASQDSGSQYPTASGYRNMVTLQTLKDKMEQLTKAIFDSNVHVDDPLLKQYHDEALAAMKAAGYEPAQMQTPQVPLEPKNTQMQPTQDVKQTLLQHNLVLALQRMKEFDEKKLSSAPMYPEVLPANPAEYEAVDYHFGKLFEYVLEKRIAEYRASDEGQEKEDDEEFMAEKIQNMRENLFQECTGNVWMHPREQKGENAYLNRTAGSSALLRAQFWFNKSTGDLMKVDKEKDKARTADETGFAGGHQDKKTKTETLVV